MILTVLKIIGAILLALLGLILFLAALILFVPVRYKGYGQKAAASETIPEGTISVSWFLHILSACFEYKSRNSSLTVKVFGFRLKSKEEKEKKKEKKEGKRKRKQNNIVSAEEPSYTMVEYDETAGELKEQNISAKGRTHVYVDEHEDSSDVSEVLKEQPVYDKISKLSSKVNRMLYKIKSFAENTLNKITGLNENFDHYYNALINDARNRAALNILIVKTKRLLKAIAPRKIKGQIEYGSSDPAATGRFLAGAALLYPIYGRDINVSADFENEVIAFNLMLKGRIYIFTFVRVLLQLYFNKNVKRFIHIMKKENSNG